MSLKTCLRCDWQGDTTIHACPNCGAEPLYVVDPRPKTPAHEPPSSQTLEGASDAPVVPSPPSPPADLVEGSGRPIRAVVVFALAAVLVVAAGTWINANRDLPSSATSTDAATSETPAALRSSTPPPLPPPSVATVGPSEPLGVGRHSLHPGVVPLSFRVPSRGWYGFRGLYVSKDTGGAKDAEAIIFWTEVWRSTYARACGQWWGSPVGDLADWAAQASRARGTDLIASPAQVTIDGHTAQHVVLSVRNDADACNPGLFHRWKAVQEGPFWTGVDIGDTIRIWLVDDGRKTLYIEADTHRNAGSDLKNEIRKIVGSIRFD